MTTYNEDIDGVCRVIGDGGRIIERFERIGTEWTYADNRYLTLDDAKRAYEKKLEVDAECARLEKEWQIEQSKRLRQWQKDWGMIP